MKKNLKFMKYATFCVISLFMTSLAFTGCKNYDEDVKRIDSEIAALKASVSSAASSVDGVKSDLATAKTDLQNQVTAAKTAADAAKTAGDAAKAIAEEAKAAAAQAKLDAIAEAEKMFSSLEGEIEALKKQIADNSDLDALKKEVEDLKKKVEDAVSGVTDLMPVNGMITSLEHSDFYWGGSIGSWNINFNPTKAVIDYTFGAGMPGETKFVKGQPLGGEGSSIFVRVNPISATLTADKLFFVNSKGETTINDFIKIEVEKYDELLTKVDDNGLWEVMVTIKDGYTVADLLPFVQAGVNKDDVLFSLVVENKVADNTDKDRYVSTAYDFAFDVNEVDPVYNPNKPVDNVNLAFNVNGKNHINIRNRYTTSEGGTPVAYVEKRWNSATGKYALTSTGAYYTETDAADNRQAQDVALVAEGKSFKVQITNSDIYKFYVTLDNLTAVESAPSEINAWLSYNITGINEVKRATEAVEITIPARAKGDFIGFRVYAVNYDGTLVDPDGKAFYVYVGENIPKPATVSMELNYQTYKTASRTPVVALEKPTGLDLSTITGFTFEMDLENSVTLNAANVQLWRYSSYNGSTSVNGAADLRNANFITLKDVPAKDMLDDGTVYEGTLGFTRTVAGSTVTLGSVKVYLTKLVEGFTASVAYRSGFPTTADGITYLYPVLAAGTSTANLGNVFNGLTSDMIFVNNTTNGPTYSVTPGNYTVTPTNTMIGSSTVYSARLAQSFVNWKYNGGNIERAGYWDGSIKLLFRSMVQDFSLAYKQTNIAAPGDPAVYKSEKPELVYGGGAVTYSLANVNITPPYGPIMAMNATGAQTYDGARTYTIAAARLVSVSNGVPNEFFTTTLNAATNTVTFTQSHTGGIPADVELRLQIQITDEFGTNRWVSIGETFKLKKN